MGTVGPDMAPIKLIHTADVHLDLCFAGAGMPARLGNRRRQSLRDVFHAIVQRAGAWPADALLIAGDLLEHDRVTRDTVAFLISEFASIPHVPVFIAPGNHDPYTTMSPYATETWPAHVHFFTRPEWQAKSAHGGRLVVHGFAFDGPDISSNPFGKLRIPAAKDGAVHVAVAHGSERGHQPPHQKDYAPFSAADVAQDGLLYLALGHFHSMMRIEGDFKTIAYYPGAPEGLGFKDTGMRHYLEVEIDDAGVRVTPIPSSRIVYASHELSCERFQSSHDLIDAIRAATSGAERPQLVRITLTGTCAPSIVGELGAVHDTLAPNFEYLELIDETAPPEDYEELEKEDTSLGQFVRMLNAEIADAPDAIRTDLLRRAREAGVAAFRGRELEIRGLER
jgi:DNA repair exonuclease SbcCD nuclease subunit